jgi:ABC-2 type transport system ATP-binding protein
MENGNVIEVESVSKRFASTVALQDVSFQIKKGELVGLLGTNGAGKTTLMRIMTCFLPATSGRVRICGLDIDKNSLDVRSKIGYFIEKVPLYYDMRVADFLHFVAELKMVPKNQRKKAVSHIMAICGLEKVNGRIVKNLSKGYRQRVGLAQAMINDPEVLILDEPTIGLDPEQVFEIRDFIKGLGEKRTVILCSHNLYEVNKICSRVIIIDKGKIIATGTPDELGDRLQAGLQVYAQIEGPEQEVLKKLKEVPGFISIEKKEKLSDMVYNYLISAEKEIDIPRELGKMAFQNGWILRDMRSRKMNLEEIFLKLVVQEEEQPK